MGFHGPLVSVGVDPGLHLTAWAAVASSHALPRDGPIVRQPGLYVIQVGVWRTPAGLHDEEAVVQMCRNIHWSDKTQPYEVHRLVVESQQVYEGTARVGQPADLIRLATISGVAMKEILESHVRGVNGAAFTRNPLPQQWKGSVEKVAPQARACLMLGWNYTVHGGKNPKKQFVVPKNSGFDGYSATDWKNIMDAIAMAIWGLRQ